MNLQPTTKAVEPVTVEPTLNNLELLDVLKYVDATITEIDKMKANLLGIKAQIKKFVK